MNIKKKHRPYVIGYCFYASIMLSLIIDHCWNAREFWSTFIFFLIIIPFIVGYSVYFIKKFFCSSKASQDSQEKSFQKEYNLFIENWTLIDFARTYGPTMEVGTFTNSITGEDFKICRFTDKDGKQTDVIFFSQLGELTPEEIAQKKNELKIGKMQNGKYYLHNGKIEMWQAVNLSD